MRVTCVWPGSVLSSFDVAGLVASCLVSVRLAGTAAAAVVGCWAGRCGGRRGGGRWGSLAAVAGCCWAGGFGRLGEAGSWGSPAGWAARCGAEVCLRGEMGAGLVVAVVSSRGVGGAGVPL
jgi:hypothetical protein